jgi:MFS family permease
MQDKLDHKDAYAVLKIRDFRWFIFARFFFTLGIQMQSVIVGWQIYSLTHDALSLGLIGLSEAIPYLCIALFAGHVADVMNRKKIIMLSTSVYFVCTIALFVIAARFQNALIMFGPFPIYLVIFITGLARGFLSPAISALAAQLVPRELYGNASTWNSMAWQTAAVAGPAIGGLIYGFFGIEISYQVVMCLTAVGLLCFIIIQNQPMPERTKEENIFQSLKTGLKFVYHNQILLSALSLDMFAVFFGGAVSVLPIFADQILHTGAKGLGFLRAAPAFGAIIMSMLQVYWPPFKHAGRNLLYCVFGFGLMMIMFAISKNFWLTMFCLILSGMFDNVSVIIRATIVQLYTPNEMRGRVSAINGIFIGSSNELGSFESGVAAKLMGLIPSVIFGGGMTLAVVGAVRNLAPKLRKLSI